MAFYSFYRRIISPSIKPWGTFYPWTPARITTALWLDAADSDTITIVSDKVNEWQDKSGNDRHAVQTDAARRPVASDNAIVFNSTNSLGHTMTAASSNVCLFIVAAGATQTAAWRCLIGVGANINCYGVYGTNTNWGHYSSGASLHSIHNGTKGIIYIERNAMNIVYRGNGSSAENKALSVYAPAGPVIGGRSNTSNSEPWGGDVHEIIVSEILSEETRQKLEGYLAHKWLLTGNLPSDHPYKTRAPRA